MKHFKKLQPEQYKLFCSTWREQLTRKFPKGMPITRKNLEWATRLRKIDVLFAIDFMLKAPDWFYDDYHWRKASTASVIRLALAVARTGKLTKAMCKKAGLKENNSCA